MRERIHGDALVHELAADLTAGDVRLNVATREETATIEQLRHPPERSLGDALTCVMVLECDEYVRDETDDRSLAASRQGPGASALGTACEAAREAVTTAFSSYGCTG